MPLTVLLVVLLAAALHAGWNALIRASSHNLQDAGLLVVGAAVWTLPFLPLLPLPDQASWPFLALSTALHIVYFTLVGLGYRFGQLSFCYPLMRGSAPLLTALLAALLFAEVPSAGNWFGIAVICGGVLLLATESRYAGSTTATAAKVALANGLVIACYTLVDGYGVRLSGQPLAYTGWLFVLTAAALLVGSTLLGRWSDWRQSRARWVRALIGGGCSLAAYGLVLWAMTRAPIALVAALRESSVAIAALIGTFFLKERLTPLRLVSIGAVTVGAMAIQMF